MIRVGALPTLLLIAAFSCSVPLWRGEAGEETRLSFRSPVRVVRVPPVVPSLPTPNPSTDVDAAGRAAAYEAELLVEAVREAAPSDVVERALPAEEEEAE